MLHRRLPPLLLRPGRAPGALRALLIAASLAGLLRTQTRSDEPPRFDAETRRAMATELGELFVANYVFEDVARRCAEDLRTMAADGAFDPLVTPRDFAESLSATLRDLTQDKHVRLRARPPEEAAALREDSEAEWKRRLARSRSENFGFEQLLRLEENVGMIDLRGFAGVEHAGPTAVAAMNFLATSDALIIDLRRNGGGDPEMVQLLCSYFFAERTHLNSLYWRAQDRTDEFWTLDELQGPRLADVPVVILTSGQTFSAAEEFTSNLKTRGRATVVGETTGGGAHPVNSFVLGEQIEAIIPVGRAINPVTETNWEGTGVDPDVPCHSNDAMDKGLELARELAREYRASMVEG